MRLIAISVVKNEADVVEAFVRHTGSFADHHLILDNGSTDGTREMLTALIGEGLPLTVVDDPTPGHWQKERTTRLMHRVASELEPDWILPIDADEFLVTPVAASIHDLLEGHCSPVRIPWQTYVPTPSDDQEESNPVIRIRHRLAREGRPTNKIVVPGPLAAAGSLHQGNHDIALQGEAEPLNRPLLGEACLAHFPARSVVQLAKKIAIGEIQYLARGNQHDWGFHYHEPFEMLVRDWDEFAASFHGMAARYGLRAGQEFAPEFVKDPIRYAGGPLRLLSWERSSEPLRTILEYAMQLADRIGRADSGDQIEPAG